MKRKVFRALFSQAAVAALAGALFLPLSFSAQEPSKKAPGGESKFKAIWEPVNVKEDLELMSVHFVSADEGWVAGGKNVQNGGVILHTADGGATWEVQLGDPQSSDRAYRDLRFIDAKTGFAVQSTGVGDHKLLRTTDGQSWVPLGTVGQHRTDYEFVTADVGFYTAGEQIFRTTDGGRRWQRVFNCRVKAEVQGLSRDVPCQLSKMFFLNNSTGYAVSNEIARNGGFVVAKTADGGTTWTPWVVLPGENAKEGDVHFFDENSGVLRTIDGKLFRTTDGGQTWTGVTGQPEGKPDFEFADGEVGWMMRYRKMYYTNDAGKRWLSSTVNFPAPAVASSLPARDRGYAAGEHGMVYRYRIVPVAYTSKGMLSATMIAGPASK
jgi:photosystem II stability/assembly factor-like uncharacterized protein